MIGIAPLMRRLLTGYAISFSRRYRRHGRLFQNRYKSLIYQEDRHLQELARDIHLNPLRAGMASDLAELARRLYLTLPAASHAVNRGGKAATDTGWDLGNRKFCYLRTHCPAFWDQRPGWKIKRKRECPVVQRRIFLDVPRRPI
jgi:hypothetical protein